MKNKFKGFTLIECLVALAILGIASLTMAQIYASVSIKNRMNHLVNTSLSNQIRYVEMYTNKDADIQAVPIYFGGSTAKDPECGGSGTPPHKQGIPANDNTKPYLKIVSSYDNDEYSYAADVFVLFSRDRDDNKLSVNPGDAGYTETNDNLRYKYIVGHNNG